MKKIIILLVLFVFISCKKNDKKEEHRDKKPEMENIVNDNIFKLVLNIKIEEDDKLEVYFAGIDPEIGYNANERVSKIVKGKNNFQNIEFLLPKDILPYYFRIDLGDGAYKQKSPIEIKSVTIYLNKNKIVVNDTLINSFFEPNMYLESVNNGVFNRNEIEGKYDPYLESKPVLNKRIEIEL